MFLSEIQVGCVYEIDYKDNTYPCDCPCHLPNSKILHFGPCCYDSSFKGKAVCISKSNNLCAFARNPTRYYIIHPIHVIKLCYEKTPMPGCNDRPMKPWFNISEDMIKIARQRLE